MLGEHAPGRLLVVDTHHTLKNADAEVGTGILLPPGAEAENDTLANPVDTQGQRISNLM